MELMENIKRFGKILEASVPNERGDMVTEVARSLIIADIAHIGDPDRGKYEHLTLCGLAMCHIPEYRVVDKSHGDSGEEALSDVMQMRIMCDTLTLLLDGDQPYAMRYTADVAKAMGQRVRSGVGRYLEYAECEKILDSYYEKLDKYGTDLREVFRQTSEFLDGLRKVQLVADKNLRIVTSGCVENIWLPEEFDSFGFDVSTKMPLRFEGAVGDLVELVSMYNFASIIDVLVRTVVKTKTDTVACILFVSRIDEMCSLSKDLVPIGTKVLTAVHPSIYYPSHFMVNETVKVVYSRLFSDSVPLSAHSVDSLIQVILRYYKVLSRGA